MNDKLADEPADDDGKRFIREQKPQYADKGGHGERHKLEQQKRDEMRDERKRSR